ncbi:MAG TPA: MBOAT family protein [Nitrospirota bacterium]|nr:MBOAT family protein [Nitrospirota bacterium]
MLFNSYEYLFLFLPVTLIGYFVLNRLRLTTAATAWLVLASLFFYSWWNVKYLPLIIGSILWNFAIGMSLRKTGGEGSSRVPKRLVLIIGITANIALLGYYKYTDFFITNLNTLAGWQIGLQRIVLPLGISFFTFTQIAYLVDVYQKRAREYDFLRYALFVTFFPHLLAGPIIHHKEMMPQFANMKNRVLNYRNISMGLYLFFIGLFKKVIIADELAPVANFGFDTAATLTLVEAWATSLSYTFQLYFDFSAYTDMALGASFLFNIRLPFNFNSPYKAKDIADFWRRWHMTLSRFLRDYVYIPLGGNREGENRTYFNLLATFLIGGIWHGAGWNFVFWGFLHGAAAVIHRVWSKLDIRMHRSLAWFITFNFVNIAWVFFRAKTWDDAIKVIGGMFGMSGVMLTKSAAKIAFLQEAGILFGKYFFEPINRRTLYLIVISLLAVLLLRNSDEMAGRFKPTWKTAIFAGAVAIFAILNMSKVSEFLYFNF